jgi:hypothetical protein
MHPPAEPVLESTDSVEGAYQRVQQSPETNFLIRLRPSGWSSVTRETLAQWQDEGRGESSLRAVIGGNRLAHLHPDLPLDAALRHLHEAPLLPVVNRADFRKLEGVISQEDVLNRYKLVERQDED